MDEYENENAVAQSLDCGDNNHRTSLVERLQLAHAEAISEIERDRDQPGQLTRGINGRVGDSILNAGVRALTEETGEGPFKEPKQFVVAAPPGTGKTSHTVALMAAIVRNTRPDDLLEPYGCLFVVDQIKKADEMFQQINKLLPGQVAVWTTDHDLNAVGKPAQMKVPYERRFDVEQLEQHAVAVVTQAFLRGPRGDKARQVIRGDQRVRRALTIFDEQTREVDVYDVKRSQAFAVQEAIERNAQYRDVKTRMGPLLDFIHVQSQRKGNTIETPEDDPQGWRVARELEWFASDEAEQFVRSNQEIEHLDNVFGLAAQMYNNCAFIYRRGGGEAGSHFMAYVPVATPTGNSVLLDATADIDRVSELCSWRTHVPVPQVRYNNLHIVHAPPYTKGNLAEFFLREPNRRKYIEHAKQLIRDIMPVGARGLIVCKKKLVEEGRFLNDAQPSVGEPTDTNFPLNFDGRHLAVTWWGGYGIGANDWKDADYVFHFDEHILPTRTMFAMVQGLRGDKATSGMLSKAKSTNITPHEVALATEGHLLRFMKQMGMRGNARTFDEDGLCGKQVLVLTCDFERLLTHAHLLFPGATLCKWDRTQEHFRSLKQAEMLMEIFTDPDQPDKIDGDVVAQRMGVERWGSVSSNVMRRKLKMEQILRNLGWAYEPKRGPGGGSWFIKTANAVLKPNAWKAQVGEMQIAAG